MGVFEKGQFVRVLHTDYKAEFPVGSTFKVGAAYGHGVDPEGENSSLFFLNEEIEPWRPRVGDRIRLVKDGRSTIGAVGKTGTISKWSDGSFINDGDYLIDIDPPVNYETFSVKENLTRAQLDCLEPVIAGEAVAMNTANIGTVVAGALQPVFKIGDRVRRVEGRNPGSEIGHVATILQIDDISSYSSDGPWLKFTDGTSGYATSFVLVDPKASNDNRADAGGSFKAGDRIRLIANPTLGCKIGDEFTAVARTVGHSGSVHYTNRNGQTTWRPGSYFELVTTSSARNDNTPVAQQPATPASQPKFKVGDRVKSTEDGPTKGLVGIIVEDDESCVPFRVLFDNWTGGHGNADNEWWLPADEVLSAPPTTTIVALIENGQPKPSVSPRVHASTGAAEDEALRLAEKYKGKQFGVFTLTATHLVPIPVYDHKWQNLAAKGEKIDAIKELRSITGIGLKPAKDAVEYFLAAA